MSAPLGEKAVGSIIKLKANNALKEFVIVHQGKPGTMYDDSCNGTWLLMKDVYESREWHSSNSNDYANSTIHSYLNSTFLNLFESNIKDRIKQVKIPYRPGSGTSKTCNTGANGLSTKIFLLSCEEVGLSPSYKPTNEGAKLSYFTDNNSRIGKLNGSATYWWLRSPSTVNSRDACSVTTDGGYSGYGCSVSYGIRPALVLPSTLSVADDGTIVFDVGVSVSYGGRTISSFRESPPVAISYGGRTIASVESGNKTLSCAGKICSTDIAIGSKTLKTQNKLMESNITVSIT